MGPYRTCDSCRRRKSRCLPGEGSSETGPNHPCTTCRRLDIECTFLRGYKKAGRKSRHSLQQTHSVDGGTTESARDSASPPPRSDAGRGPSRSVQVGSTSPSISTKLGESSGRMWDASDHHYSPSRQLPETPNSRRTAPTKEREQHTSVSIPWDENEPHSFLQEHLGEIEDSSIGPLFLDAHLFSLDHHDSSTLGAAMDGRAADRSKPTPTAQAPTGASNSVPVPAAPGFELSPVSALNVPAAGPASDAVSTSVKRFSLATQVEDVAPWTTINFFLMLYLQYMHSLLPLVHKPSFSQVLLMRLDRHDRNLRAFILGLVAYTVGQAPLTRMEPEYSRSELETLQRRCHRASMVLLDRSYNPISILQVGTLITGYFYFQSVGNTTCAAALLSEACQLTHLMRIIHADAGEPSGRDFVETELLRRLWWHVYAVDITEASAGNMIHLSDYEGFANLPLSVDDELITSEGAFPQPSSRISYMAGFAGCVQLFPTLAQCVVRNRRLLTRTRQGKPLSPEEVAQEREWVHQAREEVGDHMASLPAVLRVGDRQSPEHHETPAMAAQLGMQRANILITEASVQFALYDYAAELGPQTPEGVTERSELARRAYRTLSSIPIDDLAANGESMRGKIIRILGALMRSPGMGDDWVDMVQGWWSLFSEVNFVQLVAREVDDYFGRSSSEP